MLSIFLRSLHLKIYVIQGLTRPIKLLYIFDHRTPGYFNEGVYNILKSNSQVYNCAYKLHFTILDYGQNFRGSFRWKCIIEITWWAWYCGQICQINMLCTRFNHTLPSQTPFILHHKNTMYLLCSKEKRHTVKVCSFNVNNYWGMADIVDPLLKRGRNGDLLRRWPQTAFEHYQKPLFTYPNRLVI